jgi:hypothetical protein
MWRAAWYKVDAPDMSLPVFLEYLVASVAQAQPGFGCQTLACRTRSSGTGGVEAGAEINIAELAEAFVCDLERRAEPSLNRSNQYWYSQFATHTWL